MGAVEDIEAEYKKFWKYRAYAARIVGENDAEDAVQYGFMLAFRHAHTFRQDASISTWLSRIVRNAAYGMLRKARVRPSSDVALDADDMLFELPDTAPCIHENLEKAQQSERLRSAIAKLPRSQREAIEHRLRFDAEIPGINHNTAKVLRYRGTARLRSLLMTNPESNGFTHSSVVIEESAGSPPVSTETPRTQADVVLEAVMGGARTSQECAAKTGISAMQCAAVLGVLEKRGKIHRNGRDGVMIFWAAGPRVGLSAEVTVPPERKPEITAPTVINTQLNKQKNAAWEEQLLQKFPQFDPLWPDEIKGKWFDGFSRLMEMKSTRAVDTHSRPQA